MAEADFIRQLHGREVRVLLDVATGTADVALEAVRQLKPDRVVGVDISREMLDIGRSKVNKRGLQA